MGERGGGGRSHDVCPYQGLVPFESTKAELFFGRTRATRGLLDRLAGRLAGHGSVLLVSGASGVGKSSLLRAGLMPALAEGMLPLPGSRDWPRLLVTPGADPFAALAAAWVREFGGTAETTASRLRHAPGDALSRRFVLVVDQFEELFTLVSDERERQAYVRTLHALAQGRDGAAVIVGVRADYWDRCAAYPRFAAAIQDGQVIVEPMTEPDLRLAITGPAATAGLRLEPGLVEIILAELGAGDGYEAGALPLLSQALRNTWERREKDTLTVRGYEDSGRVRDSVRRTADEVLDVLRPDDRKAALRVFRRMTTITAGGRVARRRATLAELHAAASAHDAQDRERTAALLSAFADRRLLTLHEDSAEIAHDALLTAWPALRRWLEPDLSAQSVYDGLVEAAAQWADNHRDPAFLYRGPRLLAVQDSRPRWERDPDSFPPPGATVESFVAASEREARRTTRRRRLVMSGLVALSAIALVAAGTAVNAADAANRQRGLASSRQLALHSEVTGDTALASMLAVAAWKIAPTNEARNRVLTAATRTGRGTLTGHGRGVKAVAFSPDGALIATGSDDGTARLWDAATRRQIGAPITRGRYECSSVRLALSTDGRTLATACLDSVLFYDVRTRRQVGSEVKAGGVVRTLAFNPDGRTLATGDSSGVVQQWDVATQRPHGAPMGRAHEGFDHKKAVLGIAYSKDGKTLATAGEDRTARLWDTATSRQFGEPFTGHAQPVTDVAISPDGSRLATVSWDRTGRVWDVATRKQKGRLIDRTAGYSSIAFSPDGTRIATGGDSGRTVVWDTASRRQVFALADNYSGVDDITFSPDGTLLAAASGDGVVRLADPWTLQQKGTHVPASGAVALSPDGRILVTGVADEKSPDLQLWDAAHQRPLGPPLRPVTARPSAAYRLQFTPDGRTLLSESLDGIRLWDVASRREIAHEKSLHHALISSDGRFVAAQRDKSLVFWDLASRRDFGPRITVRDATDVITAMALSPDDRIVATAGFDDRIRFFDVATGKELPGPTFKAHGGLVNDLAFSPDGQRLAVTAYDNSVRLWDVPRRRPVGIGLITDDGMATALGFSPDSKVLATGLIGGDVQLWDLLTYRRLGPAMRGHGKSPTDLVYSRDGTTLATASGDRTARLWNVRTPPDLVAAACANAGRSLTREEWENLVPQEEYRQTCP
ncbi:hypothetical protein GCM10009733_061400 [Nonomuraea maheshkhaliensis]|uniref:Novel STAND NTPase 1 domain-containing protein n=1 Tax=Nonomuraea maheshkhaliensis TaxID=419590 RepID=A0ABN2FPH7_9ACTN